MKLALAVVLAFAAPTAACLVQADPQAEQDLRLRAPGRYLATVDGQPAELILNADGSGTLNGQAGQWAVQLGSLMLSDGQQWVPASLDGGVLTVQSPEGAIVFQRQDVAVAAVAGGPALGGGLATTQPDPVAAPAAPGPAAAGPLDGRLVGCWEDYLYSTGGAGSGSHSRTIRLGADGRYAIRTFSSISAGELSTVSDQTETGGWRVEDGSLAMVSDTHVHATFGYKLEGGLLFVDGTKLVPCT